MQIPDAELLIQSLAQQIRPWLEEGAALVGIHSGGVWLAQRILELTASQADFGTLDISFYRDDFNRIGLHSQTKPSSIPFEVEGRHIVLVDDVLYTGRTIRGAMNELFDYGRPAQISLAVLVDRGGRELPVAAQYIGATLAVPPGNMLVLDRDEHGKLRLKFDA